MKVEKLEPFGAVISGLKLADELKDPDLKIHNRGHQPFNPFKSDTLAAELREVWLQNKVIALTDQPLTNDQQVQVSLAFGQIGDDPFFGSIPEHPLIASVQREADEQAPIFAETWHSDWSFMPSPPIATTLSAKIIPPRDKVPPQAGDTRFQDCQAAFAGLSADKQAELRKLKSIHSAALGYAPKGRYGDHDTEADRSMDIRPSEKALETHSHPIVRQHEETGIDGLFISPSYTMGIEDLSDEETFMLLTELYAHMEKEEFVLSLPWENDQLVMWDNRALNHMATGGYQGHKRLLHRTTISRVT